MIRIIAEVAELVDALDLKSNGEFFTVPVRVRLSAPSFAKASDGKAQSGPARRSPKDVGGVWRSGLARLVWDEEVVGSNPTTPTHSLTLSVNKILVHIEPAEGW